eukprot:symbB.v1.2.034711.t1/scaffold4531.1/size38407/1
MVAVVPEAELSEVVPESPKGDKTTSNTARRRDSFQRLSAVPVVKSEHGEDKEHHGQALPCCLILYVCALAILCGFLVSGCHKAFVYSGCILGINGCNSLNGYKYEKMGYILVKAFPEVPEEIVYITSSVAGAFLCGLIIVCLPQHLQEQVKGGGTCQSLVAVATGVAVPLRAAILRISLALLFLMSGGSMGAEGPSIQVCTSFAMLVGWYSGIRAAVTQSLLASLGFSCGFAASFNAPLAGITFAMEERRRLSTRRSLRSGGSMAEVYDFTGKEMEVISEVAEMLNQLASFPGHGAITCFDSPNVPPITLRDYLTRLWRYMHCSIECYVTALAYIDRLQQKDLKVGVRNVHTVFLGCLVVAAKFHDDAYRSNTYYARVGGVTAKSLYFVETETIKLLDWKAKVTVEEFLSCCDLLFSEKRWLLLRSTAKGYLAKTELRRSSSESITASTATPDESELASESEETRELED